MGSGQVAAVVVGKPELRWKVEVEERMRPPRSLISFMVCPGRFPEWSSGVIRGELER